MKPNKHIMMALSMAAVLLLAVKTAPAASSIADSTWPADRAEAWAKKSGWLVGCNFTPSSAINQLDMWQAATFDPITIERELAWAESIGFNSIRVFLHHLPWQNDRRGFLRRMDVFLDLASRHRIGVMFVLLDSCWHPFPHAGPQQAPKPFVHNSGWVQCPGRDILCQPERHAEIRSYVTGVVRHFRKDKRVHAWDIFNEPDNRNVPAYARDEPENKREFAFLLIQKAYAWARESRPTQPITSAVWLSEDSWADPAKITSIDRFMLEQSDVISFHCYGDDESLRRCIQNLRRYRRPILCTEYMARPNGSTFDPHLSLMKSLHVAAYNWGFVDGKTQTIYPWDSWTKTHTAEPALWFHDIFRRDGKPYKQDEIDYIKRVTGKRVL